MTRKLIAVTALLGFALPASANAHVSLQPTSAPAGGEVVENVQVANETDDAVTTKLELKFPDGFAAASYAAIPGWGVEVKTVKLATPVETDDGPVTEGVSTITWTARAKADGIAPGQFKDFPISILVPGEAGDTLTFKALQTYDDGEVVRWIGAEGSEEPAPTVAVTAAEGEDHPTAAAPVTKTIISKEQAPKGLSIAALIVATLGLGSAIAALAMARRKA